MLINITPRPYQTDILKTCIEKSCLVVLPTGLGKTLIALMLAHERLTKHPRSKILFLAPTRPLAEQHLAYFKKHLPELYADMQIFTGKINASERRKIWQTADIIFSTPQCIGNDIKNNLYSLSEVSLLIEDECHRCFKNYAYTAIAKNYNEISPTPRVLGLTASPGSEKSKIKEICQNLGIEAVEIRTRDSSDVKPYLQHLAIEAIKVDFPQELEEIRLLIHPLYKKKVEELQNRKVLFKPATKTFLLECQAIIMKSISSGNKNMNMFAAASACAQAIKLQHLLELLETQTLSSTGTYIEKLLSEAAESKSKASKQLANQPNFAKARALLASLLSDKKEHPKLSILKDFVQKEMQTPETKIIVFSQYRDTVSKISAELNSIEGVKAKVFVGQQKRGNTGLNQKEQQAIIREFSTGEINILCATSIGEEGLDIPEVNAVILYEPVPSAIRQIQRRGRTARLMKGKLIILVTKNTRDEAYYWSAFHKEKKMHSALNSIKEEIEAGTFDISNKDKPKTFHQQEKLP
ncbi:MAG: DEAD/DEAH box helicase family protein [Nanoarchaeota archaeon]